MPCRGECGQYEWVTDPWSVCTINTVDKLPACGEGVQSRKIRWVRARSYRATPSHMPFVGGHDPFRSAILVLHIVIVLFSLCDRCVRRGGEDQVSSVNETFCDQDEIPPQAQTCTLPCPNECVMSQWSHWSTCPMVRCPFDKNTIWKFSNVWRWLCYKKVCLWCVLGSCPQDIVKRV